MRTFPTAALAIAAAAVLASCAGPASSQTSPAEHARLTVAATPSSPITETPTTQSIATVTASVPARTNTASVPPSAPATPTPAEVQTSTATAEPSPTVTLYPVYLTFDDGPHPKWTPQILDVLAEHDAHATFFMLGTEAQSYPKLVRRVAREGHAVASHTWNHPDLTRITDWEVLTQVADTSRALGQGDRCVRPPYGATDGRVRAVIEARGDHEILWDVDPQDWSRPGPAKIVSNVLDNVKPGSVVVMHDGGGDRAQTVKALESLLPALAERGYTLAALPQCLPERAAKPAGEVPV